ncbi:MAG: MBL fold metallo-hydrolase [Promethearchaeota archaeon]
MTTIRAEGKVNDNTTLIDIGLFGAKGTGAVYLVQAGKSCLIDCGTKAEAPHIAKTLKQLNAFPPDIVLITHAHYDHCQGVPVLRNLASEMQKDIQVVASERALPLLEDQSFNRAFYEDREYENIYDVTTVKEGEGIDLEGLTLSIIDVPGHCIDHIAALDEKNKNLFIGDAIGYKVGDSAALPAFMPPFWDETAFRATIEKLHKVEYETICLGHFGYVYGSEAKDILDESIATHNLWWGVLASADENGKLDDISYLVQEIVKAAGVEFPHIELVSPKLKYGLKLMNGWRRLRRKAPLTAAEFLLKEVMTWLVTSYKITTQS